MAAEIGIFKFLKIILIILDKLARDKGNPMGWLNRVVSQ